jgi:hypothetical protein
MTPALHPRTARATIALAVGLAVGSFAETAHGQAIVDSARYVLTDHSAYNIGCYGPCDCAVRGYGLEGTFLLRFVAVDPLYTHYAVENLRGFFLQDGVTVPVTGEGEYRIGGEVALTHQMRLDLRIDGRDPRAFDSGVVPGGSTFPDIVISVAAHGFACYDTVIDLSAKQLPADVPGQGGAITGLRVIPNPFRIGSEMRFLLSTSAMVEVVILDAQGRELVTLMPDSRLEAGPHRLAWRGRLRDGSSARPGVYFVRIRTSGADRLQRVVKLE